MIALNSEKQHCEYPIPILGMKRECL
jgi:hypothetical protein